MEWVFYEINCIKTKLWELMSKKYKIHEDLTKRCANSLKIFLSKIYELILCTYVLSTHGNSYSDVRSIFTMKRLFTQSGYLIVVLWDKAKRKFGFIVS